MALDDDVDSCCLKYRAEGKITIGDIEQDVVVCRHPKPEVCYYGNFYGGKYLCTYSFNVELQKQRDNILGKQQDVY